jgi:hypothetical protein
VILVTGSIFIAAAAREIFLSIDKKLLDINISKNSSY